MECPVCQKVSVPTWEHFTTKLPDESLASSLLADLPHNALNKVALDWMRCAHEECQQLIVRIHEQSFKIAGRVPVASEDTWIARPRFSETQRLLDPLIGEPFRTDYQEAAAILDASPRMSAVLSRGILADLLEEYAKLTDFKLSDRVDKFKADHRHPSSLRENIDHFREIGNFGAHTTKNDQDQIIPVSRDGAEWMLDFLDRLFDYLIVGPERDRAMRATWDKNLADAGRKPIPPLRDES